MGSVDPDRALTVIRGLPDCPSTIVTDDGEALSAMARAVTGGAVEVVGGVVGTVSVGVGGGAGVASHCGA